MYLFLVVEKAPSQWFQQNSLLPSCSDGCYSITDRLFRIWLRSDTTTPDCIWIQMMEVFLLHVPFIRVLLRRLCTQIPENTVTYCAHPKILLAQKNEVFLYLDMFHKAVNRYMFMTSKWLAFLSIFIHASGTVATFSR